MSSQSGYIPLVKSRVLYLGSSIPLETSIGLESVQQPLRDRYGSASNGGDTKVTGIDTLTTVFSGGLLLEYVEDPTASTWFPIQNLHVCCCVRPVRQGYTLRFVPIDSPEAANSQEPPIFAAITRRPKGVKVLECHAFICKTTETALALVQSCTHAFQHKEGWMNETPPIERLKQTATRLIPAENVRAQRSQPGFSGQAKQYTLETRGEVQPRCEPEAVVVTLPAPARQLQQPIQQQQPQPFIQLIPQLITQVSNTTKEPDRPQPPPQQPAPPTATKGYFSDWRDSAGQAFMIVPESPFFSGQSLVIEKEEKKKKKSKKHHKEEEVEYIIIKKSANNEPQSGDYDDDDDDDDDEEETVTYPDNPTSGGQGYGGAYFPQYDYGGYDQYYNGAAGNNYGYGLGYDQGQGGYGFDQGQGGYGFDQGQGGYYYPSYYPSYY